MLRKGEKNTANNRGRRRMGALLASPVDIKSEATEHRETERHERRSQRRDELGWPGEVSGPTTWRSSLASLANGAAF